jgi:hypothetical protein
MTEFRQKQVRLAKEFLLDMVKKGYLQPWYCLKCNACYLAGRAPNECACGSRDFEEGADPG